MIFSNIQSYNVITRGCVGQTPTPVLGASDHEQAGFATAVPAGAVVNLILLKTVSEYHFIAL